MRNGKLRGLLITVMLLVFLAGLASILYPYIWGAAVDSSIASTAKDFLEREEPELPATTVIIDSIKPEKVKPYPELWEDMVRYNQNIAAQGQSGLSCAYDYQKASFQLADYGLPDEIFGVLSIPAIDLEMPIYLGATEKHMADGIDKGRWGPPSEPDEPAHRRHGYQLRHCGPPWLQRSKLFPLSGPASCRRPGIHNESLGNAELSSL